MLFRLPLPGKTEREDYHPPRRAQQVFQTFLRSRALDNGIIFRKLFLGSLKI